MKLFYLLLLVFVANICSAGVINQATSLFFIENKGQLKDQYNTSRKDIDITIHTGDISIFIGCGALHYQFLKATPGINGLEQDSVVTYRMDIELIGHNKNANLILEERQPYYEHYYTSGIAIGNIWQSTYGGGILDAFITKFTTNGIPVWSSYYGGLLSDIGITCYFDHFANLYVIGKAASDNGIATTGAYQTSNSGGFDNACLARINDCIIPLQPTGLTIDTFCINDTVTVSIPIVNGALSYTWTLPGGWTGSSTTNSITMIVGTTGGAVSVVAHSACGSSPVHTVNMAVYPTPFPVVIQIGSQLNTGVYSSYQWNLNGSPIIGATSQFYTFTQPGTYTVSVIDSNGCKATSPPFPVGVEKLNIKGQLQVYPNPTNGTFVIQAPVSGEMEMYDMLGKLVKLEKLKKGSNHMTMGTNQAAGTYFIRFISDEDKSDVRSTLVYKPQ